VILLATEAQLRQTSYQRLRIGMVLPLSNRIAPPECGGLSEKFLGRRVLSVLQSPAAILEKRHVPHDVHIDDVGVEQVAIVIADDRVRRTEHLPTAPDLGSQRSTRRGGIVSTVDRDQKFVSAHRSARGCSRGQHGQQTPQSARTQALYRRSIDGYDDGPEHSD
jgi:hypothetical protein